MEKEKIWSVDELVKESRDSLKNEMEESYDYLKREIDGDKEQATEKAYEACELAIMNYIEELEATLENGMKIVPERKRKLRDICFYLCQTIKQKSGESLARKFDIGWLTILNLCTNYYGERELMSFEELERELSYVYRTIKIVTDELPRDKEWATSLYEEFNPKPQNSMLSDFPFSCFIRSLFLSLNDKISNTLKFGWRIFSMESEQSLREEIQQIVRNYPDFPTQGILFRDVLPLFAKPALLQSLCKFIANRYKGKVDVVAGLEARGFLFGSIVAYELGLPFVPIRKKGKLPGPVITAEYQKEYGTDVFQMQQGVLEAGQRVLLLDDLLATGGSLKAAEQLVKMAQAEVAVIFVVIELSKLDGRKILSAPVIDALISYSD